MARLEVVEIPPKPVNPIKEYVLHLNQDEVEYLAKLTSSTDPQYDYADADAGIYDALRDIRYDCLAVDTELSDIIHNCDHEQDY